MKNFALGFLTCLLIVFSIAVPYIWPPELSLVFNSVFWSSVLMLLNSCLVVGYLYFRGGSTQAAHFIFSLSLIISAALMYSGLEQIAANTAQWEPLMRKGYPKLFVFLPEFISYTKNIVAFGFAALGASVAANVITHRFNARSNMTLNPG
jgi:hypothetical protein